MRVQRLARKNHRYQPKRFFGWIVVAVFLSVLTFVVSISQPTLEAEQSYAWVQDTWAGDPTDNTANHTDNQAGWTEYSAADDDIFLGGTVTLERETVNFTESFQNYF